MAGLAEVPAQARVKNPRAATVGVTRMERRAKEGVVVVRLKGGAREDQPLRFYSIYHLRSILTRAAEWEEDAGAGAAASSSHESGALLREVVDG